MMSCQICGGSNGKVWKVREMMIGAREEFDYFECFNCECLQLVTIPENISKYYSNNYYSLNSDPQLYFKGKLRRRLKQLRDYDLITGRKSLGWVLNFVFPNRSIELENFKWAKLKKGSRILDVGSGTGTIPYIFKNAGFTNIAGVDPYLKQNIQYDNGLVIEKKSLFDVGGSGLWDVVMFNHSFEHVQDPLAHLRRVRDILRPEGLCIIRIPCVSSFAWREYRTNWVQLDAPRHFFLYSKKSLHLLAEQLCLRIDRICYESTPFQFIGSEQYKRNVSLWGDAESYFRGNKLFTHEQLQLFTKRTKELNRSEDADSIAVILKRYK